MNPPDIQRALEYGMSYARDQAALAQRKANTRLVPRKPQQPCDHGLFSDEAAQIDLIEMLQEPVNEP